MATSKLVVCYSLGTGAGIDLQLASMSRQISEDLAEILALNDDFVTLPQTIVVREAEAIEYDAAKNACAFAVFYSLPETKWILSTTRAIGGDIALTGRIVDDESGILLSVNLIDIQKNILLFCGVETAPREGLLNAITQIAAKILAHFTDAPATTWIPQVRDILGTESFPAYVNWMAVREAERRAQREGLPSPAPRSAENLIHALAADPAYTRAGLRLCELLSSQLPKSTYELILRYLKRSALENEALALIVTQALARLGSRLDAESTLTKILDKFPQNGLFWLMRGCLRSDNRLASKDLDEARRILGNDFNGCRAAVDNALLNVTGI